MTNASVTGTQAEVGTTGFVATSGGGAVSVIAVATEVLASPRSSVALAVRL